VMVQGSDHTDWPITRAGSDYGSKPDCPTELDGNEQPQHPLKSAWNWYPFEAPRLAARKERVQNAVTRSR
jgi:hypothetical protein